MVSVGISGDMPANTPMSMAKNGVLYRITACDSHLRGQVRDLEGDIILKTINGWICLRGKNVTHPYAIIPSEDMMKQIEVEELPIGAKITIVQEDHK